MYSGDKLDRAIYSDIGFSFNIFAKNAWVLASLGISIPQP